MPPARAKRGPPKPSSTAYTPSSIFKSNSPLTHPTTDLHAFLLTCLISWSTYTPTEQRRIISSIPPAYRTYTTSPNGELECPLSIDFIHTDAYLKTGIERFKREVGEGYYEATWRKNATLATQEREEGKFDEYVRGKVEMDFGEVAAEDEQESSESDKGWGKERDNAKGGRGKGKNVQGLGRGKARLRAGGVRGEMRLLATDMEE
jgi:Asx homology domain